MSPAMSILVGVSAVAVAGAAGIILMPEKSDASTQMVPGTMKAETFRAGAGYFSDGYDKEMKALPDTGDETIPTF